MNRRGGSITQLRKGLGGDMIQIDNKPIYPQIKFYLSKNPRFGKNEVTAYHPTRDEYEQLRALEPTKIRLDFDEWRDAVYCAMVKQDRINNEVEMVICKVAVIEEDDPIVGDIERSVDFVRWV